MPIARDMRRTGAAICASCLLAGVTEAQEFCVSCAEPAAVYRCVIDGARPGGNLPLQMLCVTAMSKEGPHRKCAVRGGTVFDCKGPVKRVSWAAYNEQSPVPIVGVPPVAAPPAAAKPESDPAQPPRTIEEMAKRANQKTAEQLRKANDDVQENVQTFGEKMSDASKKTWRCLSSFFTQCTE